MKKVIATFKATNDGGYLCGFKSAKHRAKVVAYLETMGIASDGWHYLQGDEALSDALGPCYGDDRDPRFLAFCALTEGAKQEVNLQVDPWEFLHLFGWDAHEGVDLFPRPKVEKVVDLPKVDQGGPTYGDQGEEVIGFLVRDRMGRETLRRGTDGPWGQIEFPGEGRPVLEPGDAVPAILKEFPNLTNDKKEHFIAVYLDTRRHVIGVHLVSLGTLDSSLVHPREVFAPALELRASAVLVAHNHPSGNPEPSAEDLALTRRLDKAASLLGLAFLDHLILGRMGTVSLRERQRNGRTPCELFGS